MPWQFGRRLRVLLMRSAAVICGCALLWLAHLLLVPCPLTVRDAVRKAGWNGLQVRMAYVYANASERSDMAFLLENMPDGDLQALSAYFLLENVRYAQQARANAPWAARLSDDVYRQHILPYASVTERRDRWRKRFYTQCHPLVRGCTRPGEAAVKLNQMIYTQFGVRYDANRRPRADQGPLESIEAGYASCTGLSILLVDACRSVGIPARLAGVAHWTGTPGNHTWVEVWDDGWHCLGAAESAALDSAWFTTRAGMADPTDPLRRVYAVSFTPRAMHFPLAWAPASTAIYAEDVTARYRKQFGTRAND